MLFHYIGKWISRQNPGLTTFNFIGSFINYNFTDSNPQVEEYDCNRISLNILVHQNLIEGKYTSPTSTSVSTTLLVFSYRDLSKNQTIHSCLQRISVLS